MGSAYFVSRIYFCRIFSDNKIVTLTTWTEHIPRFGRYFEDHSYKDCKVIHPDKALQAEKLFKAIKSEVVYDEFMIRIAMEDLYNAKTG